MASPAAQARRARRKTQTVGFVAFCLVLLGAGVVVCVGWWALALLVVAVIAAPFGLAVFLRRLERRRA